MLNDKLPGRTFVESEAQPGAWTELEFLRAAPQLPSLKVLARRGYIALWRDSPLTFQCFHP